MDMKILALDFEIKKAIQGKGELKEKDLEYCEGWSDKENMGISLGWVYMSWKKLQFWCFDEHNILELIEAIKEADLVIHFNGWGFDVPLLKATLKRLGYDEETGMSGKNYDLMVDVQNSHPPEVGRYTLGWKMGQIAEGTLGVPKSGEGAAAPRLYQENRIAELSTYGLHDTMILINLFYHAIEHGELQNGGGETVTLKGIKKWRDWTPELGKQYIEEAQAKKAARKEKE